MGNKRIVKWITVFFFMINIGVLHAQNNWRHTDDDRKVAVEVDTIKKKGFTLIWINKDKDFDLQLKERLIDVHFVNYPKLAKKYNRYTRKEITFVIDPDYEGIAATAGGIVRFNPAWFVKNPHDIDIVTHEVMHIVQDYPGGSGPGWLVEGIADYVRYKYGVDNGAANWRLPDFKEEHHYTNSYRIAARFLDWAESTQKRGLIKKLDTALRDKKYTANIWMENTGKTLDQLWNMYSTSNLK
ncbi:basic secretory protein-like protein [Sphingobacterium haloxyli]|uniref:Secretory protein n=1 Tax=Sphingobacterium haloxyli TaxID=2100533 RepID=A0A2S9J8I5_9SPHI|nr:basic secretory protein-like protein [Sphingobacterium haloxyli]PRD49098.1 secretory protein [Sphingobacterium haloxyli]